VTPSASAGAGLRPLGIGDVIDRVFGIYRARAIGLFVIGLILFVAVILAWIALTVAFAFTGASTLSRLSTPSTASPAAVFSNPAFLEFAAGLVVYFIVGWLITLLIGAIFTGAVIDAAAAAHLGQSRSISQSLGVGFRSSLRIFLAGLIASVAVSLIGVVYNIIGGIFDNNLLLFLLSLVYFFVLFYVQASWFVAPVVATIERHGPVSSLRRSWQLSGGFRWRIVGLFVLLVVLFLVLLFLIVFAVGLIAAANQTAGAVAIFIAVFAAVPLWMPLFFGTMTVLYYDLHVRKEGLDLQLAAEAMPRG